MQATIQEKLKELETETQPQVMRGARILCEALLREGVDTIFGYPGGAVLHIYNELVGFDDRLRHVLARHEQGAIHMAEGYAKATGRVGEIGRARLNSSHITISYAVFCLK